MCFSATGDHIITASEDRTVRVWSTNNGKLRQTLKGHENKVRMAASSKDAKFIASCSDDKTIRVWKTSDFSSAFVLKGHNKAVTCICFSPDSSKLVSGSLDKTLRVWDMRSGMQTSSIPVKRAIHAVAFFPEGNQVLVGCKDEKPKPERNSSDFAEEEFPDNLNDPEPSVSRVHISVATPNEPSSPPSASSSTSALMSFHLESARMVTAYEGHKAVVVSVSVSSNGKRVASASYDKTVRVYDAASGDVHMVLKHPEPVLSVCFADNNKKLLTSGDDGNIRIWDVVVDKKDAKLQAQPVCIISLPTAVRAAWSLDGRTIAASGGNLHRRDHSLYVWHNANRFTSLHSISFNGDRDANNNTFSTLMNE